MAEFKAARTPKNPRKQVKKERQNKKEGPNRKLTKPALNVPETKPPKDSKLVFSKIEERKEVKAKPALPKDPVHALKKIQEKKTKLNALPEEQKQKLKREEAWNSAIQKSEGVRIRNDEGKLKKILKKREKMKEKRAERWQERTDKVKHSVKSRQNRRQENIQKRIDAKKERKMKKRQR